MRMVLLLNVNFLRCSLLSLLYMLNKILKHTALFGAILVFIGYVKLHIYYSYFGVDIINYLEIGEIVTSFLDDIWYLFVIGVLYVFIQLLLYGVLNQIPLSKTVKSNLSQEFDMKEEEVKIVNLAMVQFESDSGRTTTFIFLSVIVIILNVWFFMSGGQQYILLIANSFFTYNWIIIFFSVLFKKSIDDPNTDSKLMENIFGLTLSLFVVVTICFLSFRDIYKTEMMPSNVSIQFSNGREVNSNDNFIFLGKTSNYYYFYDTKNDKSSIFQSSEMEQMVIKQ